MTIEKYTYKNGRKMPTYHRLKGWRLFKEAHKVLREKWDRHQRAKADFQDEKLP